MCAIARAAQKTKALARAGGSGEGRAGARRERVCVCVCACARVRTTAGQAAMRRKGDEETRGVVMVRGKEGARKRACKRALAISVRVAPARK